VSNKLLPPENLLRNRPKKGTTNIKRIGKQRLRHEMNLANLRLIGVDKARPKTRADCLQGPNAQRPCPFVSCKHHLYLDVNQRVGSIKLNFSDLDVGMLWETCSLDVADRNGASLDEIAKYMNLGRERVRQIEEAALAKLKDGVAALGISASDITHTFSAWDTATSPVTSEVDGIDDSEYRAISRQVIRDSGDLLKVPVFMRGDMALLSSERGRKFVLARATKKLDRYKRGLATAQGYLAKCVAKNRSTVIAQRSIHRYKQLMALTARRIEAIQNL